jgi:bifunctional non-homologous end joining protein LigD
LHGLLDGIELTSFVKTTGGKGLHVVVPIARRYTWPQAKTFAKRIAELLAERAPARYLTRISKA